jgi:hypothetical protein
LLRLDAEKMSELVSTYARTDVPREHVLLFERQLLQNDAWFVEVGDSGLFYLTHIVPGFLANFNAIFFDKRFGRLRREMAQIVLATAFVEFDLKRIAAFVPASSVLAAVELPKIGFMREGILRRAWRDVGGDIDMHVFGLLRGEARDWQVEPKLRVSYGATTN